MAQSTIDRVRETIRDGGAVCDVHLGEVRMPEPDADHPAVFRGVTFEGTDFGGLDFGDATFEQCTFIAARLDKVDLRGARFTACRFYDADAGTGCSLRFAVLESAEFDGCDLSLCDLHGVKAWNLVLRDCTAQGIDLTRADCSRHPGRGMILTAFTAERCNLSFATLEGVHLAGAVLTGSRLREAVLDDVDLTGADLRETDLSGVTARRLVLTDADLRDARIEGLDPRRIDLSGARIRAWQAPALLEAMGLAIDDD